MIRPTVRAGLAALVVATSVAFVAPVAQAVPPTPPVQTTQAPSTPSVKREPHSGTTYNFSKKWSQHVRFMVKNGKKFNKKRGHVDWKVAKKVFGKHTTWRDDFGAGWYGSGNTFDHISKSDRSKLKKRWLAATANSSARTALTPLRKTAGCQGVTKNVAYKESTKRSENWYDSCDTHNLQVSMDVCGIGLSVGAGGLGWVTEAVAGPMAMACATIGIYLNIEVNKSKYHAVKYYFTRIGWNGNTQTYSVDCTIHPQN